MNNWKDPDPHNTHYFSILFLFSRFCTASLCIIVLNIRFGRKNRNKKKFKIRIIGAGQGNSDSRSSHDQNSPSRVIWSVDSALVWKGKVQRRQKKFRHSEHRGRVRKCVLANWWSIRPKEKRYTCGYKWPGTDHHIPPLCLVRSCILPAPIPLFAQQSLPWPTFSRITYAALLQRKNKNLTEVGSPLLSSIIWLSHGPFIAPNTEMIPIWIGCCDIFC